MIIRSTIRNYKVDFANLKKDLKHNRISKDECIRNLEFLLSELHIIYAKVANIYESKVLNEIDNLINEMEKEKINLTINCLEEQPSI